MSLFNCNQWNGEWVKVFLHKTTRYTSEGKCKLAKARVEWNRPKMAILLGSWPYRRSSWNVLKWRRMYKYKSVAEKLVRSISSALLPNSHGTETKGLPQQNALNPIISPCAQCSSAAQPITPAGTKRHKMAFSPFPSIPMCLGIEGALYHPSEKSAGAPV